MYEPGINSVLVEIDDRDAEWGGGNDDSMLGKSYSKGKVVRFGGLMSTQAYPINDSDGLLQIFDASAGKQVMWNEGVEAGTTFEHDGKLYGFIYWWDIRGVKVENKEA